MENKTIIKFSLVLLFICFHSNAFSQNKGKTVTLDGLVVKLDEVSEDKPLKIKSMVDSKTGKAIKDSSKIKSYVLNEITIHTNKGKNSFLKIYSKLYIIKNDEGGGVRATTVSFYNSQGNKRWEKKSDLETYFSRIELKGKYIFIKSISPATYIEELTVFDSNGNEIFEDKYILRPYFNSSSNSVCYETESLDIYTLHFYNANKNSKWKKTFPPKQRASYFCISPNGENIAACIENYLHVWNFDGSEIWNKPYKGYSGFVNFSTDGNYLLWNLMSVSGHIEIYDNIGKLMYKSSQLLDLKGKTKKVDAEFIEGLNELVIIHYPTDYCTEISIMSIKGNILKKILINKKFNETFKIQKTDNNTLSIYLDNILIKSVEITRE